MNNFNPSIKHINADAMKDLCVRHGRLVNIKKNEFLVKEGEVFPYFGFVKAGIFKYVSFNRTENRPYNTGFAFPDEFVADYPACIYDRLRNRRNEEKFHSNAICPSNFSLTFAHNILNCGNMKTKLSLSLFALLALTGCLDDGTPEDKVETITVAISAITYIDSPVTTNYPIEGMRAKVGSNADYQFMTFNEIEGFTFEPGYAYELQVERTTLGNPPADASRYTYKLLDERSKQPVECTRETVRLYVSAETGNYDWGIPQADDAHCMKIRESENEDWMNVPFNKIIGFTYEEGDAYELSVEKITLDAQPADKRCQTVQYVLQEIISQSK